MPIPFSHVELSRRHAAARAVGEELSSDNRCALVMGMALRIQPDVGDKTHRGQKASPEPVRNQPLLDRYFLRAGELAKRIECTFGAAELTLRRGQDFSALKGQKGVLYLDNCWSNRKEKAINKLTPLQLRSGDHIDLWDGEVMAIYSTPSDSRALLGRSETIKFWRAAD